MKRLTCLLVAVVALAGVVASMAPASGQAGQEAAPIFVTEIPPGYRDWRLISVAHEAGDLNDIRAILGNDVAIKAYREGTLSVPGRHHHCPARLELRRVGGKQPRLWPSPIIRGRAPQERAAVYGQGRKQIRGNGRLGVRALRRRQTRRRGGAQHLLSLPPGDQRSGLGLHPIRTLILRTTAERHETMQTASKFPSVDHALDRMGLRRLDAPPGPHSCGRGSPCEKDNVCNFTE